jgi:hypothetical protein
MIINRIGPLSIAKLSGLLYAIFGLVFGGIFSLIAMAGGFASDTAGAAGIGAIMGVGAVIVFPIFYGLLGFVSTLVGAWLYNVAADVVGGVEVDIQ